MENSSIFKPYQKYECCRGEKQFMLKTSIGRQLPYIVNFKKSTCQIFDIEWEKITHSFTFPDGCQLIDVDYFPTKEGQLGILIAIEDTNQSWGCENFVVAMAAFPDVPKLKITHSAKIPQKITTVKTLFSAADMSQKESLNLHYRLMTWNHVVAVGCVQSSCHLARLTEVTSEDVEAVEIHDNPQNLMNLLTSFTSEGVFQYIQEDGSYREYPSDDVFVSALTLMPRSRTLLVGFSMGGILAAALNPSNQMLMLELRHERLIRRIAPLEPEDDPDKFEYFIAAVDRSPRHPIMIQLWRGSFKTLEVVDPSEKYDRPFFNVCLEHKIPFGERWLAVNPIVSERKETNFRRSGYDSMLNTSQSFGAAKNRNSVLLAFEKQSPNGKSHVEAAIFDMDAWYYKRVPGRVSSDDTVLRQSPFLSCIKTDIVPDNVHDIGILTLDSTDVSRFSSLISDADQLFYPSALSFERVFVAETTQIRWMKIQNIQDTILSKCASKLPLYIRAPDTIFAEILAAGIVRKSVLSPNSSVIQENHSMLSAAQKVVLNAMFYYGKVEELCKLAAGKELNEDLKKEIGEWAVREAVDFKRAIADKTVSVFQGSSSALSPPAENAVLQGIKLFRVVYEYLKECSKHVKVGAGRLRNLAHSMKCMMNHTKLISRFIGFCIIPVDQALQDKMREEHEKRKAVAERNRNALPVQVSVRTMHRLCPEAQFWNNACHEEWFPPTPVDLLESILNVNIPQRVKREVVVQYVLDWLRAQDSEESQKTLAIETIKVMTNQMFEVDLEKIYHLLDQEKIALETKKTLASSDVLPLEEEPISYVKLWNGEVPTLSADDLKRFERRMRLQIEKGKLPLIDRDSEMLYQVYLFENEKFELMSQEAIESNKLLSMFLPGMVRKDGSKWKKDSKTTKQKEIEESVRKMFERNNEKEAEDGQMYASLTENGRKWRGSEWESPSRTESIFVPPTAKRLPYPAKNNEDQLNDSSINSTVVDESGRNEDINKMIATPAKYYKRPMQKGPLSIDVSGKTPECEPSKIPAQNSILKTAKSFQSPSRGRIRFHESVPEMTEEKQEEEEVHPLNFSVLDEEEEEAMMTTRRGLERKDEEEECLEMETSFEDQEEAPEAPELTSEAAEEDDVDPEAPESPESPILTSEAAEEDDNVLEASEPQQFTSEAADDDDDGLAAPESQELTSEVVDEDDDELKAAESQQLTSEVADEADDVLEASESQKLTSEVADEADDVLEASESQKLTSEAADEEDEAPEPQQLTSEVADRDDDVLEAPEDVNADVIERTCEIQEDEDCEPLVRFEEVQEELEGAPESSDALEASEAPDVPEAEAVEETFEVQVDEIPSTSTQPLKRPSRSPSATPTPSKRPRGRPPKTPNVVEKSPSRPRGRPPKKMKSEDPTSESATPTPSRESSVVSSSTTPGRKRGRPRKDEAASVERATPRSRGRPRKVRKEEEEASE